MLLTQGVVKVVARSEDGYEMLLAVRIAGDLVGEMAALEDLPRSGSVVACSEVTARIIQRETLESFLKGHPDSMMALFRMLSARLRWANQRRLDFRAYDSATRLARVLAELTQSHGTPVEGTNGKRSVLGVMLTQSELASLAGLALPTAEKALASLSQHGLVERSYRALTVSDVPRLLAFAKLTAENPY